jgi:hypothetical protein
MTKKYIKKPIPVEAIQWLGDNPFEICNFVGDDRLNMLEGWGHFFIETLEGEMRVDKGSWVIKGPFGEFWPVKEEIFKETYEEIKEEKMTLNEAITIVKGMDLQCYGEDYGDITVEAFDEALEHVLEAAWMYSDLTK